MTIRQKFLGLIVSCALRINPCLNASKQHITGAKSGWEAMGDLDIWPGFSKIKWKMR